MQPGGKILRSAAGAPLEAIVRPQSLSAFPFGNVIPSSCMSSRHDAICHEVKPMGPPDLELSRLQICELRRPFFYIKLACLGDFGTVTKNGLIHFPVTTKPKTLSFIAFLPCSFACFHLPRGWPRCSSIHGGAISAFTQCPHQAKLLE